MIVDFYHLDQTPLERVLPSICEKVMAAGERLLVVATPESLKVLDQLLWTYAADAFLPHARGGGANAERQPILLADQLGPANGATNVALVDGIWREEALGFARTFYLFDSARLDDARAAWRALTNRPGLERRFWKQEGGRWMQGP